jgi:hypothetical protein
MVKAEILSKNEKQKEKNHKLFKQDGMVKGERNFLKIK